MQNATALNNVINILQLIGVQNIELLVLNIIHLVLLRFPCCVGQAILADIYGSNLRIFVAAGVDDLVSRSASGDQNLRAGFG